MTTTWTKQLTTRREKLQPSPQETIVLFIGSAIFKFSSNSSNVQLKRHFHFETDKFDTEDEQTAREDELDNRALTREESML